MKQNARNKTSSGNVGPGFQDSKWTVNNSLYFCVFTCTNQTINIYTHKHIHTHIHTNTHKQTRVRIHFRYILTTPTHFLIRNDIVHHFRFLSQFNAIWRWLHKLSLPQHKVPPNKDLLMEILKCLDRCCMVTTLKHNNTCWCDKLETLYTSSKRERDI